MILDPLFPRLSARGRPPLPALGPRPDPTQLLHREVLEARIVVDDRRHVAAEEGVVADVVEDREVRGVRPVPERGDERKVALEGV